MGVSFLSDPDDLQWLRDVHLANCELPPFAVALIEGNEDSPNSITLYEHDHVNSLKLTLVPDDEGNFHHKGRAW